MTPNSRTLVSVVIPTYNRAHLIRDALDSVASQTWTAIEIVLVDDGSTDGTLEIVRDWTTRCWSTDRLKVFRQEKRGGNAARNTGIGLARGDYVAFLDSDDEWHPEKIERQMAELSKNAKARAVYCGLGEIEIGSATPPRVAPRSYPDGDLSRELLVRDVTAPTSCYLIERDLLTSLGSFDEGLAARQDWDLWIRISQETDIAVVPEPLVTLRSHPGPRTISDPTRELEAHARILKKYETLARKAGFSLRRRAKAAFHLRAGRVHFHHLKSPGAALSHYVRALVLNPIDPDAYYAVSGMVLPRGFRQRLHRAWNAVFGRTALAIRSH